MRSVSTQSYRSIEHLIIDGASSDGTLEVIRKNAKRNVILVSEPDLGIYDAMNKGVKLATGDIICFLNSDDIYSDQNVIKDVVCQMKSKKVDVLLTDICFISLTGKIRREYSARNFSPSKLKIGWMPPHPGMFLSSKKFFEAGLFNVDYKIAGDYEFCIRLFNLDQIFWSYYSRRTVHMAPGGVSSSGLKSQYILNLEVYKACQENGIDLNLLRLLLKYPKKLLEFLPRLGA